ncbi:MAG TPA: hypothetical protein VFV31_00340 [Chitinophagaceae bacterium]|nr:hypothetical protein [Chitinophagaceae bacterium]
MKKILIPFAAILLFACNSGKKEKQAADTTQQTTDVNTTTNNPPPSSYTPSTNSVITVEGKDINLSGSILVDKDPKKLQAGAPYRGMITSSSGPDNEGYILRFVFDTKPGVYPVTGISYGRGKDDKAQQFGGLLGGEEKIYDSKVNLTECTDLGDNGAGGHKWKISGSVENVTIPALSLMLIDKTANHPKEIKVDKITFNGITFDDNAEEMLKKAMEMLEKKK